MAVQNMDVVMKWKDKREVITLTTRQTDSKTTI